MRHIRFRLLAISSLLVAVLAAPLQARTRPRYGGALRLQTRAEFAERLLAGIVFETLVTLDDGGKPQPALATSWEGEHDGRRWQFWLRRNVRLHDGTVLTPADVVESLSRVKEPWSVRPVGDSVVFESEQPMPQFAAEMALPEHAIARSDPGGRLIGTGPYRFVSRQDRKLSLKAHEDYWNGQPYAATLEIVTERPLREQMTDFALDHADVVEVGPELLRRAQQEPMRAVSSQASETIFLVVRSSLRDPRLRQALALSIDRGAILNVLLQKQGTVAGGVLPNWLTGHEFLFKAGQDLPRARQLRAEAGAVPPFTLAYDSGDGLERLIAERIALNAREAGINVQAASTSTADLRLERVPLPSLDPAVALRTILARFGGTRAMKLDTPESLYAAEREFVQSYSAVPLVHMPRGFALQPRVRDWTMSPEGNGRLDQVWLEAPQ